MRVFLLILARLVPLYLLILLGFIAGRTGQVKRESIAPLLIYIIAPVVVFSGILATPLTPRLLSLPVLFWLLSCLVSLIALRVGARLCPGPRKNILAFACGSGNTGYFGLPVAIFLFGELSVGLAVLIGFGMVLFENTLGFFITARGRHTAAESLRRVLKLPALYAFALGIAMNFAGFHLGKPLQDLATSFRGAYAVLGMMMVGLGVSSLPRLRVDLPFVALSFAMKFGMWPVMVLGLIEADRCCLRLFSEQVHSIMMLMAIVPLPANAVVVATLLDTEPEIAGVGVLASTLFGLAFIPIVVAALGLAA